MSERINQLINEIREKSNLMRVALETERAKVTELTERLSAMSSEMADKNTEIVQLREELDQLRSEIKASDNKSIGSVQGNSLSNEEIDELVNEIEFCIANLKY